MGSFNSSFHSGVESQPVNIYQQWHYVRGGETMSIAECRKLSPVN
jgi:hypothetical protein